MNQKKSDEFLDKQRKRLLGMREELREALKLNTELFNELMQDIATKERREGKSAETA